MVPFFDFKDLKLLKVLDTVEAFTLAQTRIIKYTFPPNRYLILETMTIDTSTATETIECRSLLVDDAEMHPAVGNVSASKMYYNQALHLFTPTTPTTWPVMMIPCRREISITIVNAVIAGNVEINLWAYVHQDDLKEFQNFASITR